MNRLFFYPLFLFLFGSFLPALAQDEGTSDGADHYDDRLYIKFADPDELDDARSYLEEGLRELGFDGRISSYEDPLHLDDPLLEGIRELHLSERVDSSAVERLSALEGLAYAERVPKHRFFYTPNDLQGVQWSLPQVDAELAWNIEQGVDTIEVAIVDDAVRISHEDLQGAIDTNTGEIPGNGVDDDGNGYVDDVHGWDAADNDNDPSPPAWATNTQFTHGTHVAGIAGASTDNGTGIASIGFDVELMPVKIAADASGSLTGSLQGIQYAVAADADVINMSWGGPNYSQTYQNLIDVAHNQGIVMVAAAGNNNTSQYMYPASYDHVISVGATDPNDQKASFSNYGTSIDVMAPGTDIHSTLAGSDSSYGQLSGTSMASPMVAGLAGLMLSKSPFLPPDSVEACLERTSEDISAQNPGYTGQLGAGRINAHDALICAPAIIPEFTWDKEWVCPGDSVHFTDQSLGSPSSWDWSFPGGNPTSSSAQHPSVEYNTSGTYDVKLVVTNSAGTDSIVHTDLVTVAPPTGTLSGNTSIVYGNTGFLQVALQGNPPWDITYTDGVDTFSVNNIGSSPYYLGVTPDSTTTYELLEVSDQYCSGPGSGTGTVTVTFGCEEGGYAFQKHFGTNSTSEVGHDLVEASNGDIVIAGHTDQGSGSRDIFVVRYDSTGNEVWAKTFGNGGDDWGRKVTLLSDQNGNFYVGGRTYSYGGARELLLLKLDGSGTVLWEKHLGAGGNDDARGMGLTQDGGVVTTGTCASSFNGGGSSDAIVVKFTPSGTVEMKKTYGSGAADHSTDILQLSDNGYLFGYHQRSYGSGSQSGALTRVDSSGVIQWEKYYSGSNSQSIMAITLTSDSNIIGVGQWTIASGNKDVFVLKVDLDNGNLIWNKVYGGPDIERGHDVVVDSLGDIYVSGSTQSYGNGEQVYVLKLDSNGSQDWARHYGMGGAESSIKYGGGLELTSKGELLLTGSTTSPTGEEQGYLIKTNQCKSVGCLQTDTIFSESIVTPNVGTTAWSTASGGTLNSTSVNVGTLSGGVDSICEFDSPGVSCALEAGIQTDTVCIGDSAHFEDKSFDFMGKTISSWEWHFGDGDTLIGAEDPAHLYSSPDTFQVELIVGSQDSSGTCLDTITKPVMVLDTLTAFLPPDDTICYGDSLSLGPPTLACGSPPYSYDWTPSAGLSSDSVATPVAAPDTSTEYVVEVTDTFGVVSTDTIAVAVDSSCCVSHAGMVGDSIYCLDDSVQYQDASVVNGAGPVHEWDFGPHATPSSHMGPNPPKVSYDTSGSMDVELVLTDSCGSDTATGTVIIAPLPVADAGDDTLACLGDSVELGDPSLAWHEYEWTPSDGLSDTSVGAPKASVDSTTAHYLEVTNTQTGCSRTDTVIVDTLSAPLTDLGPDSTLCEGDSLLLEASEKDSTYHEWQDGSTDSLFWVDTTGTFWVEDSNKCGTDGDTSDLFFEAAPDPDLGPDTTICYGDSILLEASDPNASTYLWDNGSTDSVRWVSTGGTYWVEAADSGSTCVFQRRDTIEVEASQVLLGTSRDTTICAGEGLTLSATAYGGTSPYAYSWDQGLGGGQVHTVSPAGSTVYSVHAVDSDGCASDTASISVEVVPRPDARILGDSVSGCRPVEATLVGSGGDSSFAGSCTWNFGDGTQKEGCDTVQHVYEEEGCYDVTLRVRGRNGCVDTVTRTDHVCVHPYPDADMSFEPKEGSVLDPEISFTDQSTGAVDRLWDFGGLDSSELEHPSYSFPDDRQEHYEVCLYAWNSWGCRDSICQELLIEEEFMIYVPNAFSPDGDGINDRFGPVIHGVDPTNYEFTIYDRWGELIFRTEDPNEKWDGSVKGDESASKTDVYVWKLVASSKYTGESVERTGHVTLIE